MDTEEGKKLKQILEKAKILYEKQNEVFCPFFNQKITLNSDGFNHLQYKPNRTPRDVRVQVTKLTLLRHALSILPKCGTVQEYRESMEKVGKQGRDGFRKMKRVQYWGFIVILPGNARKIKIIIKQVGDGKIIFWSVMPHDQKMYKNGIDED